VSRTTISQPSPFRHEVCYNRLYIGVYNLVFHFSFFYIFFLLAWPASMRVSAGGVSVPYVTFRLFLFFRLKRRLIFYIYET
jgi:hypothetical protein